jgi:hypothetical protein
LLLAVSATLPVSAQAPAACDALGDMQFVCGQRGAEDLVVLPGERWVAASAIAGTGGVELIRVSDRRSTLVYPAATARERLDTKAYPACPGPPMPERFTTHGLYVQPGNGSVHRLFVVGHGARESIEILEIDTGPTTPLVTWIGCVIAPDPIGLNSVRALPDGGFLTTNFLPRGGEPSAMARMRDGEKNGELWEWHTATGWVKVPGSEAAGANGIELSDDGRTLYMAAWGSQSFVRLSRGQTPVARDEVPLGFRPSTASSSTSCAARPTSSPMPARRSRTRTPPSCGPSSSRCSSR